MVIMNIRACVFLIVVSRSLVEIYRRFVPARCSCLEDIITPPANSRKIQAGVEHNKRKTTIRGRTHIALTVVPFTYIGNVRDKNIYSA